MGVAAPLMFSAGVEGIMAVSGIMHTTDWRQRHRAPQGGSCTRLRTVVSESRSRCRVRKAGAGPRRAGIEDLPPAVDPTARLLDDLPRHRLALQLDGR
eukprot:4166898-Prymnesium_polylepis.1